MQQEEKEIPVGSIDRNPENSRGQPGEAESLALGADMIDRGQLVPIIVYAADVLASDQGAQRYMLVDGHRRLDAALLVNKKTLRAAVLRQAISTAQLHLLQMSLEVHKVGLSQMELSDLLQKIRTENGWQVSEVAENLHMKQPRVSRLLNYQSLCPALRELLHTGQIDSDKAQTISQIPDANRQIELAKDAIHLTREQLRRKAHSNGARVEVKASVARFLLPGIKVTVQGREITLASAVRSLMDLVKHLKKSESDGLDISTAQRVLADKVKVNHVGLG